MAALYGTIWIALVLFAAGDGARSRRGTRAPEWAWWAFAAGAVLAIVHTVLAFAIVHEWSHTNALQRTALQTEALYGVRFAGGLYINYLFLAVWVADVWWWRVAPLLARPAAAVWTLRTFYTVIIFNATVVFASGLRRIGGLLLVGWLLHAWARPRAAVGMSAARGARI